MNDASITVKQILTMSSYGTFQVTNDCGTFICKLTRWQGPRTTAMEVEVSVEGFEEAVDALFTETRSLRA